MFLRSDLAVTHWVSRSMRKLFLVLSLLLSQAAHLEGRKDNQFLWKTGKNDLAFHLYHGRLGDYSFPICGVVGNN
ncbi:mCG148376, partial [Mus musculus]